MPATVASATRPAGASTRDWIAVLAGMIGAFMAILNIQITNASLLDIEGGIGTGVDNGAWVSTAYLIGEIVVIPLTDYMSRVFSFRRYVLANAILFPLFSIACSFTHDLGSMIVMRGLQGFTGGILIPVAFTMVLTKLPKHQQPIGLAIFALAVTFAPAIGPTIGGFMTENYGWQTIFYINALPSLIMVIALALTLEASPMRLSLLREGDWAGIFAMTIGLSAFQTVLEEGNRDDWLASPFILRLAIVAAVFLTAFVAIELNVAKPLVNLRLLKQRNFGIGVLANTLLGFALFGSVYILPQYLGQVQHYNAEQIGNVLAWTGLPQLMLIPLVPLLMKRFDARYVACLGIAIFAASCFMNTTLVVRQRRRSVLPAQYRARHRPGFGHHAGQRRHHGRDRAERRGRRVGPIQHDAEPGRRDRDRDARHDPDQARAVPLEHHRPVDNADAGRGAEPARSDDLVLHGARRVGSRGRDGQGHCRARRRRQAASPDHGLQRRLRRHWRPARHRCRLAALRPQAPGRCGSRHSLSDAGFG